MAVGKEIRTQISSIKSTQKITSAMEMVAASKMRKAQERMQLGKPYAQRIRSVVGHLANANPEYHHLYLQEREARIEKHQTNLNKAGTNKEYQAIQEQIAADNQANSVLGDEILEALEKIDELDAQVNAANSELAQGEQDEQRVQQTVRDATPLLEADLARLTDELNENKSQLPEDFRSEFDRISEARGEDALAPMDGETCGACYQTLNPQTVNKLLLDQLVFCPSCGCLLYLAEDRSVGAS